jgi:6-phosphogluconolactonase/glucosamine-6-phosphate isomerase/deaminase
MSITSQKNTYTIKASAEPSEFIAPTTKYCKTKVMFDAEVGIDFIEHANKGTKDGKEYLVGLSHGSSPSGAYEYIFNNYSKINHPELVRYTCINSKLERQRGLTDVMDALAFLRKLISSQLIAKDQIIGRSLDRENMDAYRIGINKLLQQRLEELGKEGLDYVFVATDTNGLVAGITRRSKAFKSRDITVLVDDTSETELTYTPFFLKKSRRIAFLATKAEKRRPLAWLFYRWAKENESPSFLRFIDDVDERMTVFIDDTALTWPQVVLTRKTVFGDTTIRVDMAKPFKETDKKKKPVVLMIHGFLGLNTFDALLAFLPATKYIAGAFHYGSIPYELPPKEFAQFVVDNIEHAVSYFGKLGHPVYIFDHSMANTYMLMINRQMDDLPGISKYLKGRIACNPFFGREVKHTALNFIDRVILKANISTVDKAAMKSIRLSLPFYTKSMVRNNSIRFSSFLIKSDNALSDRIWTAIKQRVLFIVSDIDTLPELNKIPVEHTLGRLPVKIFAIQIQSTLRESKKNTNVKRLRGYEKNDIPILVLKSERDPVAKYVKSVYNNTNNVDVIDITNPKERDLFKEHLFYMTRPKMTINIIEQFIKQNS